MSGPGNAASLRHSIETQNHLRVGSSLDNLGAAGEADTDAPSRGPQQIDGTRTRGDRQVCPPFRDRVQVRVGNTLAPPLDDRQIVPAGTLTGRSVTRGEPGRR